MRLKTRISLLLLSSIFAFSFSSAKEKGVVVKNAFEIVNISISDLNRIYCPSGISYYRYSKEKYMRVYLDQDKKNAFLKIAPKIIKSQDGIEEKVLYDPTPKDLFIKCGGVMYSLLLKPMKIPPVTIELKGNDKKSLFALNKSNDDAYVNSIKNEGKVVREYDEKKARQVLKNADSYVNAMVSLVKLVLRKGDIPGYRVYRFYKPVKEFKQGSLIKIKSFVGPEYTVSLYSFVANQDIVRPLREKDFMFLSKKPLAISIEDLVLREGQGTSIVVVEPTEVFAETQKEVK
ncbi:type-F conjugative transfer system secretin TraK [Persephonella sp. KM09-Lau-8]|uniref:TraK domain-containing protein n=1 Tax=Persephonella sp. KM09-Lau-8 TaxID=1158345 RepID=UPI0004966A14|nr:type-F conjugative transfer system secretin TraK [Persephonella sp. KM09-Lau-8]